MEIPTLQQFYDVLAEHDWYWMMSDDYNGYYCPGKLHQENIKVIALYGGSEYEALYEAYHKHMFSGEPWKTEKAPLPERPSY